MASDLQASIVGAMDTAGRAVLFAGVTVIIALLGQFALGVEFLYGLAIASVLAVLMTMLAALTVLPALLSRFGERIGRGRRSGQAPGAQGAARGFWVGWSAFIARHPWPGAIAGLAIMLTLASPALALRLGNSDAGNNPPSQTTRQAYDLLAKGFGPGFNGPLQVVASLPHAGDAAALASIEAACATTGDVASVSPPRVSPHGMTAVFNVYPRSAPQALATTELVGILRHRTLPPVAAATGATLLVGGTNALAIDFTQVLVEQAPALHRRSSCCSRRCSCFVVFRSLVIPLQAAIMNLLSIGASLGVVVAIFQWGWLGSIFDVKGAPIQAFIPVMLFAIVFGLSMDYEVFLVSRVHEEWARTRDAHRAVEPRPRLDRAGDNGGGDDHGVRLSLLRRRRRTRGRALRAQPRERRLPRRVRRPQRAAARGAADSGRAHVGLAGMARTPPPAHRDRSRQRADAPGV